MGCSQRKDTIKMLRRNASTVSKFPMSEAEALKKALAKIKRQEAKGLYLESELCFLEHLRATISTIVNDKRYW